MAAIGGSQLSASACGKAAPRASRHSNYESTVRRNLLGERHESRRQTNAQHLARAGRLVGRRDRSDGAAASLRHRAACHARGSRPRHPRHGDPRRADASDEALDRAYATLLATRPTAINLKWALDEMMAAVRNRPRTERTVAAYRRAAEICDEDVAINTAIGRNGLPLIEAIAARKKPGERVNVLTHCNAGWLAT